MALNDDKKKLQDAASVLSGVNLGASISYGESESWGWSGEI